MSSRRKPRSRRTAAARRNTNDRAEERRDPELQERLTARIQLAEGHAEPAPFDEWELHRKLSDELDQLRPTAAVPDAPSALLTTERIRAICKRLKERNPTAPELPPGLITSDDRVVFPAASVAAHFDLSLSRIQQLVREGRVYGVKPARDLFVSAEDVASHLAAPDKQPGSRPKYRR